MKRPRVLLADDHTMFTEAAALLLRSELELVGTVADGSQLLEEAPKLRPDVIVLDISMPEIDGIEAARRLRETMPEVRFVFLTMHEEPGYARRALEAGASAYLLKSAASEELLQAIHEALAGRIYLTPEIARRVEGERAAPTLTSRQLEVLEHLVAGKSMKEVAAILGLTPRTVAFHKYRIMDELDVKTTAELVRTAVEHGFVGS